MAESSLERRRVPRGPLMRLWNVVYGMLRFVAQHVQGFYAAFATFLSIAFLGAAALAVFVALAKVVLEGVAQGMDDQVLRWFALHRTPGLTAAALRVTSLGSDVVVIMLVVVFSALLWLTNHRYSTLLLLIGVLGAAILNWALKDVFLRPRPSVVRRLAVVNSTSFPSGHAMVSMVAYAAVALLISRLEDSRPLRGVTWTIAVLLILLIGTSRVYLGVHYPTDVLAGFAAGLAWIAFVVAGLRAVHFFSTRKPEVRAVEHDLNAEAERSLGVRK